MTTIKNRNTKTVVDGINMVRMQKDAYLIDIRPTKLFAKGHIDKSINIPFDRLEMIKNRIQSKDAILYIVGSYECNPKKAVKTIKSYGYEHTYTCGCMEDHQGLLKRG